MPRIGVHAPIDFRGRRTEEAFKVVLLLNRSNILFRRTKKGEMAIPVRRPQQLFIGCKDIAVARCCFIILPFEIVYPVQLPLGSEFVANPDPLVAQVLNGLKHGVVEQVREAAFRGIYDLVGLE